MPNPIHSMKGIAQLMVKSKTTKFKIMIKAAKMVASMTRNMRASLMLFALAFTAPYMSTIGMIEHSTPMATETMENTTDILLMKPWISRITSDKRYKIPTLMHFCFGLKQPHMFNPLRRLPRNWPINTFRIGINNLYSAWQCMLKSAFSHYERGRGKVRTCTVFMKGSNQSSYIQ